MEKALPDAHAIQAFTKLFTVFAEESRHDLDEIIDDPLRQMRWNCGDADCALQAQNLFKEPQADSFWNRFLDIEDHVRECESCFVHVAVGLSITNFSRKIVRVAESRVALKAMWGVDNMRLDSTNQVHCIDMLKETVPELMAAVGDLRRMLANTFCSDPLRGDTMAFASLAASTRLVESIPADEHWYLSGLGKSPSYVLRQIEITRRHCGTCPSCRLYHAFDQRYDNVMAPARRMAAAMIGAIKARKKAQRD